MNPSLRSMTTAALRRLQDCRRPATRARARWMMTLKNQRFSARAHCIRVDYDSDPATAAPRSRCFRIAQTVFGVGMTVEEPNDLSMRTRERLASAIHCGTPSALDRYPRIRNLRLLRAVSAPKVHVTAAHNVIVELSLASTWRYAIWCSALQAGDILTGRFPRFDPDALPMWADAMWRLSVEGRLAALAVRMPLEVGGLTSQECPASIDARRDELLRAIEDFSDHATACRVLERAWAVPLTWRAVCAIGEEAHLPMTCKSSESCPMVSDSTHRSGR